MADTWESVYKKLGHILERQEELLKKQASSLLKAEQEIESLTLTCDALRDFVRPVLTTMSGAEEDRDSKQVPVEYSAEKIEEIRGLVE